MESGTLAPTATLGADSISRATSNPTAALGSQDFFQLLITQLTNQDPLEPTGNEELLRQMASIREIELSTTLTESLQALSGQQQYGSASSLIGQYVSGTSGDGMTQSGVVVGVRFTDGKAILQLAGGTEMPMERLTNIQSPIEAAQALVGRKVFGIERGDDGSSKPREGVVAAVTVNDRGEPTLELDTGETLALRDVVEVAAAV